MRYIKWVSVEDRLPDEELRMLRSQWQCSDNIELIVFIKGADIPTVLEYDGYRFFDDADEYEVTHWMALPPVPSECKVVTDLGDHIEADYELLEAIFT